MVAVRKCRPEPASVRSPERAVPPPPPTARGAASKDAPEPAAPEAARATPARRPDPRRAAQARARAARDPVAEQLRQRAERVHVVRSGDTLSAIARQHGRSLDALLDWNPERRENPDLIHPGQRIRLDPPAASTPPAAPRPVASAPVAASPVKPTASAPPPAPPVLAPPKTTPRAAPARPSAPPPASSPPARSASTPPTTDGALASSAHAIAAELPYSKTGTTLAERAGYVGPRAAEARFRDVTIERPDGGTETRALLPHLNAREVWSDAAGTEYVLHPKTVRGADGRDETRYVVANEQPAAADDARLTATTVPKGAVVLPSLGRDAESRIAELEAQGYEVLGVLGTGFIDAKGQRPVGYHYVNEARLRGEAAPAEAGQRVDGLGSGKIHAGYLIDTSGRTRLLDFEGQDRAAIRAELARLERDPSTAAINLFAHVAADEPRDLVGVLGATEDRTAYGKARSMMVFDAQGELVGQLQTPAVSLLDSVTLARQVYGERAAKVLNQDGDFYAQSWFADGRPESSERALRYENAMIVARPPTSADAERPRSSSLPERGPWQRGLAAVGHWWSEHVVDNWRDLVGAFGRALEARGQR